MFLLFNTAIFTSAFLLFLIQPMAANMLLPKVGGSPNIWNACTVFFQVSLLAGYAYSYFITTRVSFKRQLLIHCVLLFVALFFISFNFRTDTISLQTPVSGTLHSLLKNLFFPFVLLSTTSPLLQRWLSLSDLKERKNPYSLYVCSNIGSIIALYAYPLLVERVLTLSHQGGLWHLLFAFFFCTVAGIAFYLKKLPDRKEVSENQKTKEKISPVLIFYWIFFAFIPSSLMLGVTSHLSTDIGGLPFLWILPLSLYLLSFILTFSRFYTPDTAHFFKTFYKVAVIAAVFLFFYRKTSTNAADNLMLIFIHAVLYFVFATCCHGILAAKKPSASNLTLFYLCLSIGGAMGGLFNTFAAPELFLSYMEYPFILVLSLPFVTSTCPEEKKPFLRLAACTCVLAGIFALMPVIEPSFEKMLMKTPELYFLFYALLFIAFAIFLFTENKASLIFLTALFLLLLFKQDSNVFFEKRNFFGSLTVRQKVADISPTNRAFLVFLEHGDTVHGIQMIRYPSYPKMENPVYFFDPDTYYGKESAAKDFFSVFSRPGAPEIAWLGLGSGATVCYPQDNARHDVFEIDRDIIEISTKHRLFRYLEHCAPDAVIKEGDARIEIAKESDEKYDLIVFDVFSSHFIPVHLTTKEAIETYRSKLKKDGILLFHISSRAFDVEPVIAKIAKELNMVFIVRYTPEHDHRYPQWGVLANSPEAPEIKALLSMPGWRAADMPEKTPLWTDDFHNLLSTLRQ